MEFSGSTDDHVGPERRHLRFLVGSHQRVVLEESLVPDHDVVIITLDAHLPQRGIARKEGRIAAPRDESFDRVAHAARPVLVMADGEVQAGAVQHLGVCLEVGIAAHADLEALAFGPLDERHLPIRPTGRSGIARQMVDLDVADVRRVLRIGRARPRHATALARRLVEIAGRHRALHGDLRATGVEVRPSEVVVGMPRVCRQCEHDARVGWRPHDEEGTVAPHLGANVDLHDDFVVARPPGRIDVQRESGRPIAPFRRGVLRRLMLVSPHRGGTKHHVAPGAHPRHLNAHRAAG